MMIKTLISRRRLWYAVLLAGGLLASWWLRSPISQFLAWASNREAITARIQEYGPLGPLVLGLLLVLQVFLGVIPGHALIMAGGYVYGFFPLLGRLVTAVVITLIGSNGMHIPVIFWVSTILGLAVMYAAWRAYGRRCLLSGQGGLS